MAEQERRRSRRVRGFQLVRVRPSDPKDENFEDIRKTGNASREGLYFITPRDSYHAEMRLFVTLPYYSPTDPLNCEYVGRVVRVEQLDGARWGVAVELLTTINVKPAATPSATQRK